MNRYIIVKVFLDPAEYLGLCHMADAAGLSQSSMVRQLIKREIATHAMSIAAQERAERANSAPE